MRLISVPSWHLPLLAGSLIVYSTITTWPSRPKSPSIMPCVCLFFSLAVKPGRCTVDTSKLLKPTMLSHCRKFSVFTGGTRSLTPRCETGTAWNIQSCSASSDGLVTSFGCSPTGTHVAFYTLNCSMASEPPAARRSASQITWRQSWRSVQYLLISSRHWHLTQKPGRMCVTRVWRLSTSTTTRRQKHVTLVKAWSQVLQHPVLVVISVAESARQNSGSGFIFVLTARLFPS